MKKQFLRVKQIADQTFLRAEKTELLTEDLVTAEKQVDTIRISCQATQKKISSCQIDFGSEVSAEKRLKKIPQVALGASLSENANSFTKNSVLADTMRECASIQTKLGSDLLDYCNEVEKAILKPISSVLENDIHNISKLRKQLGKLVLDMDSARTRFQTAERHSLQAASNPSLNMMGKVDTLKDELEDASQKVEQCRDALATEMFSLISKEPHLAQLLIHFHQLQASYHRNALASLEATLPLLAAQLADFPQKPVYGCPLEEHLRVTHRQIAQVIETCVLFLMEWGVAEEGLLRVAGSASKLKKLKSAFDAGIEVEMAEFVRDPHAVAGALKSYLRELPEPLMTYLLYEEWMNAAKLPDFDVRLQALWQVLYRLPDANFRNLQYVIKFLSKILENVDVNKMSSQNIAIVMAPNLIWPVSEDGSATFGMNMSTANLHTSIVDMLISYADYFFPEAEASFPAKVSTCVSNLNENVVDLRTDSLPEDAEINGNNLRVTGAVKEPPCSPRTNRALKKPAAPPPPAQIISNCDKSIEESIVPMTELIDFSGENLDSVGKTEDIAKHGRVPAVSPKEKAAPGAILRRRSNENIPGGESESLNKLEKPVIPDKPVAYSSCSLDRRSQRPFSRVSDRVPDCMSRSHVERPTVPPPERPNKPPKFSSSENLSAAETHNPPQKGTQEDSTNPSAQASSNMEVFRGGDNVAKIEASPPLLPRSKSSTKVNRFDFLVNQSSDKPPERPPRTIGLPSESGERTAEVETKTESSQAVPNLNSGRKACTEHSAAGPPVSPRQEVEKVKPPRPQPPAKPRLNLANENTSL